MEKNRPYIITDHHEIRQYRHSFNQWFYEIPAGGIDKDLPIDAVKRGLIEETGYVANEMIYLGECPVSQGTSTAIAYLYAAICEEKSRQMLDKTELIEIKRVSQREFESMIRIHEFRHMVGITAWYLYQNHLRGYEI